MKLEDHAPSCHEHGGYACTCGSIHRNTEARLRVAVRALECIYRFTSDNYARDALREIEASGWKIDWNGDFPKEPVTGSDGKLRKKPTAVRKRT